MQTYLAVNAGRFWVGSDRGILEGTQSSTHTPTHTDPYPYTQGYGSSHRYKGTDPLGVYPRVCLLPQGFYSHDTSCLCAKFVTHLFTCFKLLPSLSGSTVKLPYFIMIMPMREVCCDSPIHLCHLHHLVQW